MKKTIINVQALAQQFLEDEVLAFEIHQLNTKKELDNEPKIVQNITYYKESLIDDFQMQDFSKIHEDIFKYVAKDGIDQNHIYFKLLERRFSDAKILSLNTMIDLYFNKGFQYKTNQHDLNVNIDNFKSTKTIQELLLSSTHKKGSTKTIQKEIYELVRTIKIDFEKVHKTLDKNTLTFEILDRISDPTYNNTLVKNAKLTEDNIKRKYLKRWKEI